MLSRAEVSTMFLAALALALVACGDSQPAPAQTSMPPPAPSAAPGSAPISVPTPTPTPAPTYLTEEIPPCTPLPGSSVDPCQPRVGMTEAPHTSGLSLGSRPRHVSHLIAVQEVPVYTVHIVLRGTYLPGTVRCTSGHRIRKPSYSSGRLRGLIIYCFADVRVNAYIIGSGPPTLTVTVAISLYTSRFEHDDEDYGLPQLESRRLAYERALAEGGRFEYDLPLKGHMLPRGHFGTITLGSRLGRPWVSAPPGGIGGKEVVLFIRPVNDLSVEAWRVSETWDLERRDAGTVVAVHQYMERELSALTQEVMVAHQARVAANGGRIGADESLPMLVTDANRLRQYFADPKVGGYNPGVPTPAQPPPPCGLAVPDQANNPGLMRDCMTLLAAMDALRGTATLNWRADTAIGRWEGVTVGGTPGRVTTLNLSDRQLTGVIPAELGGLASLEVLWLSGNSFTGCIPSALRAVDDNDLGNLGLQYCVAPG